MKQQLFKTRLKGIAALLATSGMLVGAPGSNAAQVSQTTYRLEADALANTLKSIAAQAVVDIVFDTDTVKAQQAPALAGTLSVEEALKQVLRGTGLVAVRSDSGYIIQNSARHEASDAVARLDAVTVKGARRTKGLQQRLPTASQSRTGADIEAQRINDIQDLPLLVPGLLVQSTESNDTQITIRGLGDGGGQSSGDQNIGMPSSVSVFYDNVYISRPGVIRSLTDLDYIEVLKGANGSSFGLNTTGGVVDIHTKEPAFVPEGSASVSAGERGYLKATAMLSGPVSDTLAYRISVMDGESQGSVKNLADNNWINGYERRGARGQLLYKPNAAFQLKLTTDYSNEYANPAGVLYAEHKPLTGATFAAISSQIGNNYVVGDRTTVLDDVTSAHTEQGGVAAEANWILDNGYRLRSVSAYREYHYAPRFADGLSVRVYSDSGTKVADKTLAQDFVVESPRGRWVDYLAGLGLFKQNQNTEAHTRYGNTALVNTYAGSGSKGLEILRYGTLRDEMYSAYSRGTIHATDRLDVVAGVRATYEEKGAKFVRQNKNAFDSGYLRQYNLLPSGNVALNYRVTDDWSTYVAYGYGKKAGGINVSSGSAAKAGLDSLLIEPETSRSVELGVKGDVVKGIVTLSADVYRTQVVNFQTQGYDTETQQSFLMNAGKFRSQGFEAALALKPTKSLSVNLSASINDARYVDYQNAKCPPESSAISCDLTGKRVFNAPKQHYVADGRYDWRLDNGYTPYVTARYVYRSWTYGTVDDSSRTKIPGYGVAGLSTGIAGKVAGGAWDASLWVNNVFNKLYYTRLVNGDFGSVAGYVGDPRTIGATLKFSY